MKLHRCAQNTQLRAACQPRAVTCDTSTIWTCSLSLL